MKIQTILVIEDSESHQMLSEITIENYDKNINILQAYDGGEALKILSTTEVQPDLIFLDINMPGVDGYEFLELYGPQQHPNHSLVMLSSSNNPKDQEKCMAYSFVKKYLVKPLTPENLKEIEQDL